ncbi:transcription regulator protein [Halorhabdus tiamatea SARL4B]|uniref:Transcription regulator protein n=1 Tax=Halorhabdus tiamatea SARL4B TaxID=1033806 RepID=U2F381_9EURY|nr:helix-turn-helix domain-containing protein [Halorhabdus tiamatea]ERJ04835.1 transcription regulator protein [Halorhabdus tiamatea SARL4B]
MSLLPSTNAVDTEQHGDPRVVGVDDEQLDDVLDAISSDTARTLLSEIYSDSGTPSELSDRTNFSLQNISYHLDNLEDSGLIRVAGTRYSEKGREMNIYAPAEEPVVVFVGTQERKSGFLDLLKRVFGAVVALVAATAYVFVETFGYSAGPPSVSEKESQESQTVGSGRRKYSVERRCGSFIYLASIIFDMPSKESKKWFNTLSVLAVVSSALFMLYVSFTGSMPAVFGFKNGFVLVAVVQLFAGISLWVNEPTLGSSTDSG